jgi:hypothetical protein
MELIDINADIRVYSGWVILRVLLRTASTIIGKHSVHYWNGRADIWVHVIEMLRKGWSCWIEYVLIELFILDSMLLIHASHHP